MLVDSMPHFEALFVLRQRFVQFTCFLIQQSEVVERHCDIRMLFVVSVNRSVHGQALLMLLLSFHQFAHSLVHKSEIVKGHCDIRMRPPVSVDCLSHFQALLVLLKCFSSLPIPSNRVLRLLRDIAMSGCGLL